MTQTGKRIRVKGQVQGVGFRPFVWTLARDLSISGSVLNDGAGVLIEAFGPPEVLTTFLSRLEANPPSLARIDLIEVSDCERVEAPDGFRIVHSEDSIVSTGAVPDATTCPACLAEIQDPADRRFNYAFANCTHCGPRLSILRHIPYDRSSTTMSVFAMCEACEAEYGNPADRRFHAQPVACPICGPQLWFEDKDGHVSKGDPLTIAAGKLKAGEILAIKGLGGFQIAVDASNDASIVELRRRKRRPDKPLALMARDLDQVRKFCRLSRDEASLLESSATPIVLLEKAGEDLAESIAAGHDRLGIMLPNTPLHHLLLAKLDNPIVLTSGNLSENPQVTDNAAARKQFGGIVDGFLMHDREIVNRLDDSVMRLDRSGPAVLRRARGLAPASIRLPTAFAGAPKVLAMGGELKSTFCLLNGQDAILSQHIGDLENAKTFSDYRTMLRLYLDLYQFEPEVIAVDCHPQYLSTTYGEKLAGELGLELVRVQHHHAHLASCIAEAAEPSLLDAEVYGIVLDGLGWGEDGTVWGGEILKGGISGFERLAHFQQVALPGGAAAIREPWRNLAAHLLAAFGPDYRNELKGTSLLQVLEEKQIATLDQMMKTGVNAPRSSSAGRLFDAVAAALGVSFHRQRYEGEAAMLLESLARPNLQGQHAYPISLGKGSGPTLAFDDMWQSLIADLKLNVPTAQMAARFHLGLIKGLTKAVRDCGAGSSDTVVLTGGVFQNAILRDGVSESLEEEGCRVLSHARVPANDGGLALGQAVIAAATR